MSTSRQRSCIRGVQMLTPNVVVPALGVSLFLLIHHARRSASSVIYFTSFFRFSQSQANAARPTGSGPSAGCHHRRGGRLISDRVRVRKPFIVAGTDRRDRADTPVPRAGPPARDQLRQLHRAHRVPLRPCRGFAYAPWMAAFTETLREEATPRPRRDRARRLGLGPAPPSWSIALSLIIPLRGDLRQPGRGPTGPNCSARRSRTSPRCTATLQEIDLGTPAALHANEHDTAAIAKALTEVEAKSHASAQAAVAKLLAARARSRPPIATTSLPTANNLLNARAQAPRSMGAPAVGVRRRPRWSSCRRHSS